MIVETRKYFWLILLFLMMSSQSVLGQSFWGITPNAENYASVGNDTSLTYLKEQVQKDEWYSSDDALILLAYHYGSHEKEFILNNLKRPPQDTSEYLFWEKNYFYNLIRGYLGIEEAVSAMDFIAESASWELKVRAITRLAEADEYGHFDKVKEAYYENRENYMLLLDAYSKSPYQDEIENFLETIIQDSTATIALQAASLYSVWDEKEVVKLLEDRFYNSKGDNRKSFFDRLGKLDPDGQVNRTVWAVRTETNEHLITNYIPAFKWVKEGKVSQSYLSPSFILFLKELSQSSSSQLVRGHIENGFLQVYKPLPPNPSVSKLTMLDSLITVKDLIVTEKYNWLGDEGFVKELNNRLENARQHLIRKNFKNAAKQISNFIDRVQQVHDKSKAENNSPRYITIDGYKFLYHKATYLLNRLPVDPSNKN